MRLTVNGTTTEFPGPAPSIRQLLERQDLAGGAVVERNRDIVPRERWDDTLLADGDEVEVVRFVGGG